MPVYTAGTTQTTTLANLDQPENGLGEIARLQQIKQEIEAASQELVEIRKHAQSMASDCTELKTQIEALRVERDTLQSLVTGLSEIKAAADTSKTAISNIEREALEYKESIQRSVGEVMSSKETIDSVAQKISASQSKVDQNILSVSLQTQNVATEQETLNAEIQVLRQERDLLQTLIGEITQFRTAVEENKNSVIADVQAISQTKQQFEEMRTQAQTTRDDLTNKQGEVAGKITEINTAYDRVTQQQAALFDDKTNESGTTVRSIINQIHDANLAIKNTLDETKRDGDATRSSLDELKLTTKADIENTKSEFGSDLQTLIQKSTREVQSLRAALENEIRSLLPGAGAAGLSSAYVDAKARYAPGKFEYTGKKDEKSFWIKKSACWLWHALKSSAPPLVFYGMFLGPLVFIATYFYDLFNVLKDRPQEFNKDMWLFRGLFSLPLVTISLFGWSSIRLYRRLYEEYNHKQRVMQLYHSFKKEIEQYGTEEHQKALLGVMLTAVGDKPSLAMHRYDKGIEDLWPNLSLGGFLANLLRSKKDA